MIFVAALVAKSGKKYLGLSCFAPKGANFSLNDYGIGKMLVRVLSANDDSETNVAIEAYIAVKMEPPDYPSRQEAQEGLIKFLDANWQSLRNTKTLR